MDAIQVYIRRALVGIISHLLSHLIRSGALPWDKILKFFGFTAEPSRIKVLIPPNKASS